MSFEDIGKISKHEFKERIKTQVRSKALEYLKQIQRTKSKSSSMNYEILQLQDYLKPGNNLTIQMKAFIFNARSRMINVKCNYKIGQTDLKCRKCLSEDEDQEHLLKCPALVDNSVVSGEMPSYQDLFSNHTEKVIKISYILQSKFNLLTQPSAQLSSAATNI